MTLRGYLPEGLGRSLFSRTERLASGERVVLVAFVALLLVLDIAGAFFDGEIAIVRVLSVITTLTLALFIWSPAVATIALGTTVLVAVAIEAPQGPLLAGAIAAFFVLRLASTPVIGVYLTYGVFAYVIALRTSSGSGTAVGTQVLGYVLVTLISAGLGLSFRVVRARNVRLEQKIAEQAEHEREAVLAERRWIAGELHDSIAHYLTVISLHSQLLDDEAMRPESQKAIQSAARSALNDLRFVIKLAEDAPSYEEPSVGDLSNAIREAAEECEAAGHHVIISDGSGDQSISRASEIILARIVRESATNILKYAGGGDVFLTFDVAPEVTTLEIRSPLSAATPRVKSSAGTGVNRMARRVLDVSGEFSARRDGNEWVVSAQIPVAPAVN